MIDANQVWEVDAAIDWVRELSFANPWFIEEPTSPDDLIDVIVTEKGVIERPDAAKMAQLMCRKRLH